MHLLRIVLSAIAMMYATQAGAFDLNRLALEDVDTFERTIFRLITAHQCAEHRENQALLDAEFASARDRLRLIGVTPSEIDELLAKVSSEGAPEPESGAFACSMLASLPVLDR